MSNCAYFHGQSHEKPYVVTEFGFTELPQHINTKAFSFGRLSTYIAEELKLGRAVYLCV